MPITSEIPTEGGKIAWFTIIESIVELEGRCRASGLNTFADVHLEPRRRQLMATALLHHHLFPGMNLSYESTGKPVVDGNAHVSVSHSGNIVVMMRAEFSCGIDIERIHERVSKVRHKFLNDEELARTAGAGHFVLTQYWTAKEAMFKVYGSEEVFMRSNIFVNELTVDQAAAVLKHGSLELKRKIRYRVTEDMMLAWTEPTDEA